MAESSPKQSGEAPPHSKTQATGMCSKSRPRFGVQCSAALIAYGLAGDFSRHDKSGRLGQLISRDLQHVPVWIVKIDRVRNFVILEFEFDSALFQFALRGKKIFMVGAKGQVKHSKFAMTWRCRFCIRLRGEQRNPGISFTDKSRHAVPHAFVKTLEPEDVDIPIGRALNIAHTHGYVINSLKLHKALDRIYKITRVETMKDASTHRTPTARLAKGH